MGFYCVQYFITPLSDKRTESLSPGHCVWVLGWLEVWFTSSRSGPCLSRSLDCQGSEPGHPAPLGMHSVAWGGRCSPQLAASGSLSICIPLERPGSVYSGGVTDSIASSLQVFRYQDYFSLNDHVFNYFIPNLVTKRAIKCPFLAAVFPVQSYWRGSASPQSVIYHSCRPSCTFNESASVHSCVCSHSCSCDGEINTSHKLWMFYHLHTYSTPSHTCTCAPTRVFLASLVLFFLSGWHRDHGCHATRSVFSKTAEDSLAHVTTASRLTCYHGDKPANENSADSCDVDCELFVLRGDLFFSLSPPFLLHSYSDAGPSTLCTCVPTFAHIK